MRRSLLMVLAACILAQVARAQGDQPPPPNPLEIFLRLAALVGQPARALATTWPVAVAAGARETRLELTGADRLLVTLGTASSGGVSRVEGVTLTERLPDTLALQRRVAAVQAALATRIGVADRCAGAPGAPAFLFTPHEATRLWTRGVHGAPTRLTWRVGAAGEYVLLLQVGAFAVAGVDDVYACGVKMP